MSNNHQTSNESGAARQQANGGACSYPHSRVDSGALIAAADKANAPSVPVQRKLLMDSHPMCPVAKAVGDVAALDAMVHVEDETDSRSGAISDD